MTDTLKIALTGNPNSGKTSLFNALTGAHQHVGNWIPLILISTSRQQYSYILKQRGPYKNVNLMTKTLLLWKMKQSPTEAVLMGFQARINVY